MADYGITEAEVQSVSGGVETGVLAEAATAGDAVFKDGDNSNKLTLCEATDASKDNFDGIVLVGGSAGQTVPFAKPKSVVELGASLTEAAKGDLVVLSAAGAIVDSAELASADYPTCIGWMSSATQLTLHELPMVTEALKP